MENLIRRYKNIRNHQWWQHKFESNYAIVGTGSHNINNLIPVLDHLRVKIKYIVCRSAQKSQLVSQKTGKNIGTSDYQLVLNDATIKGIFISASPAAHYTLTLQAIDHKKNVFVEKPPCTTIAELDSAIALIEKNQTICMTGMQRRYSPSVIILKKELNLSKIISYNYRFITGGYPEGDELLELFIHPLDLIYYLFGDCKILAISKTPSISKLSGKSVFMHVRHKNIIGNIELSTNYSWSSAEDSLEINTEKGIYEMKNLCDLTFRKKQGSIFSIPREKFRSTHIESTHLFSCNNFSPVLSNNQIHTMGFYNEINGFLNLVENGKGKNLSPLNELRPAFEMINKIRECNVY